MNAKKAVYLFLALLLPGAIFIFLKLFGRNEFDVAAFYQTEKPQAPVGCSYQYEAPYAVPDSVMNEFQVNGKKKIYIVYFSNADALSRVKELKYETELAMIDGTGSSKISAARKCVLLIDDSYDVVIVDDEKKIRGYYLAADREEVDRLLMEVDIILKKY